MKRGYQFFLLLVVMLMGLGFTANSQVIISQYYEGTSNNKWIEITNVGGSSVDLSDYYLGRWSGTDTPTGAPANGAILTGSIAAGATMLYMNSASVLPEYCTGEETTATYFNGDDPVALTQGSNEWENRVDCIYASVAPGKWGENTSFVRNADVLTGNTNISVLDGSGEWTIFTLDEVDNAVSGTTQYLGDHIFGGDVVAAPSFNPNGGTSYGSVFVTITCSTDGASIYYTTNGSDPTTSSSLYSGPVEITETSTLKAMAEKEGTESTITSADYTISTDVLIGLETFESSLGTWTEYSVTGDQGWVSAPTYGNPPGCAKCSGYDGGAFANEDWLISPSFDLSTTTGAKFSFSSAVGYITDNSIALMVSSDYDGTSAPSTATWTDLSVSATWATDWPWVESGDVDLSGNANANVHLAFVYISTDAGAATWEVDNLLVTATSGSVPAAARIVGSLNGWDTTDPDYVMSVLPNGLYSLSKTLDAGSYLYKVLEGDTWDDENYPGEDQPIELTASSVVTWAVNTDANLVYHTAPVVAGDFLEAAGMGTNWTPTNLAGEMSDADGDYIWELEMTIPEGTYGAKVTLNQNWDQNTTSANVPFTTDGVTPTTFTYNFVTNEVTISGPPPPAAMVTFIVDDTDGQAYDILYIKGSFNAEGEYDPTWNNGNEVSQLYDDGTHGDVAADDHIWTYQMELVSDGGSSSWEWGVNGPNHAWIDGNWGFTVSDDTPFTLEQTLIYSLPDLVINELMYNPYPGSDDYYEYLEIYNHDVSDFDLNGYYLEGVTFAFETEYILPAGDYLVVAKNGDTIMEQYGLTGVLTWTTGGINNTGELVSVRNATGAMVDWVEYTDSDPWPTAPDGAGPSLSLLSPELDNTLPGSWAASLQNGGTPQLENFPTVPTVSLLSPNGGEYYEVGSTTMITWGVANFTGDIKIELLSATAGNSTLVASTPAADGEWEWVIDGSTTLADDYFIMISNAAGGDPMDESDAAFAIIAPIVIPDVVITEIMYNSPDADDLYEFIELYNNGLESVDLSDYTLEGVVFTFPQGVSLASGDYVVVAKDATAINDFFGVFAYQWTSGALSNGGELLSLIHKYGAVVDAVEYSDQAPWPIECDGDGPSLTFCDPSLDNSVADFWTASTELAGTLTTGESVYATPGAGCGPDAPTANFVASNTAIMVGTAISFTDLSIGAETWEWTFEGATPSSSSVQNPTGITYNTVGTFDVTLTVTNSSGEDTKVRLNYISVTSTPPPPGTNFEADVVEIYAGQTVQFTDLSSNDPTSWAWTFEGGTPASSTAQSPAVQYENSGVYTVTLEATNSYGSTTEIKEAYITVLDVEADFTSDVTVAMVGDQVSFTDLSLGNVNAWDWTFEGGTPATSTAQNPVVTYNGAGTFDVSLTVSNGYSSSTKTIQEMITVYEPSDADIVISEIMYNPPEVGDDTLEFVEIYNRGSVAVQLEGFYFGGIEFIFPAMELPADEYLVVAKSASAMLTAFGVDALEWTDGGLSNSGEVITLFDYLGTEVTSVEFSDTDPWPTACDGDGPSLTFCDVSLVNSAVENWSASTEFAGTNADGIDIFATPGIGCGYFFPWANFEADDVTVVEGTHVQFTDISEGEPASWSWVFEGGNPSTSTEQNPLVLYAAEGLFDVTLTVTNMYGENTLTMPNFIEVGPDGVEAITSGSITIFPNPTDGKFVIEHDFDRANCTIFSMTGALVYSEELTQASQEIDLEGFQAGVYFVKIVSGESSFSTKIIIR